MPTLDWIGKQAVVKHHKEVPFRLLEPVAGLGAGDPASGNLIAGRQSARAESLAAALCRAGEVHLY